MRRQSSMPRAGKPWTDAERDSLRVAWADGAMNRTDVGELLRRSEASVSMQAHLMRLGRKARGAAPEAKRALATAHAAELLRRGVAAETVKLIWRK